MSDLILFGLIAFLMGAVGLLSYKLGKRNCENERFKANQKTADKVRRLRDSLLDDAVRDKLHNRFKR